MQLTDISLLDYFTVLNALVRSGPDPVPSKASVNIHWQGTGERLDVVNDEQRFSGNYENANAGVHWSASNEDGYRFSTANSSDVHVAHAFTVKMRSGAFHP
ncbi:MAG: hypothetical protein R3300_10375 [Candidatus Promineifilaceae bacterium]|nr:hypothetical protein [Candidatus Promineifilaceae bacterium]